MEEQKRKMTFCNVPYGAEFELGGRKGTLIECDRDVEVAKIVWDNGESDEYHCLERTDDLPTVEMTIHDGCLSVGGVEFASRATMRIMGMGTASDGEFGYAWTVFDSFTELPGMKVKSLMSDLLTLLDDEDEEIGDAPLDFDALFGGPAPGNPLNN